MITSLFLIFKLETNKKRFIIDYRKLNKEIVTDSTLLLLIKNIMNQIKYKRSVESLTWQQFYEQLVLIRLLRAHMRYKRRESHS